MTENSHDNYTLLGLVFMVVAGVLGSVWIGTNGSVLVEQQKAAVEFSRLQTQPKAVEAGK